MGGFIIHKISQRDHEMTKSTGTPGEYARDLAKSHRRQANKYRRTAFLAVVVALAGAWISGWSASVLFGGAVVVIPVYVYCAKKAAGYTIQKRKAKSGLDSERMVANALKRKSGADFVLNGAHPGGTRGDCDHIVIGPCLAVVETKTGRGKVNSTGRGVFVNGRLLPRDPIGQVIRQSDLIRRMSGTDCDPVICVPNMANKPFSVTRQGATVIICSLRDLPIQLHKLPSRVPDHKAAQRIRARLTAPK